MSPSTTPASIDGELSGVADEHQPRVGADRLEQSRHQRQRHHRGLVDDHDVVGQAIAAVVARTGCGSRAATRAAGEASARRSSSSSRTDSPTGSCTASSWTASCKPRRRLARRRGERDQRRSGWVGTGRSGLCSIESRATMPSDPRSSSRCRVRRRSPRAAPLAVISFRSAATASLLAPVAVEVEAGADQPQRPRVGASASSSPTATSAALVKRADPVIDLRPGQLRQVDRLVRFDARGVADRGQVDEHVAEPRRRARPAQPRA